MQLYFQNMNTGGAASKDGITCQIQNHCLFISTNYTVQQSYCRTNNFYRKKCFKHFFLIMFNYF